MQVKSKIPEERKREVVYKVPCKDCNSVYVGETKRNLKTRLSEHRYAVSRCDDKNGVSVHVNILNHSIAWEGASVEKVVNGYWKRRTSKAILIGKAEQTMNLDCGLHLSQIWNPILNCPTSPVSSPPHSSLTHLFILHSHFVFIPLLCFSFLIRSHSIYCPLSV